MATNTGYAVYDLTLERFVSGVYKTEKQAADGPEAKMAPESHKTEVRKV